MDIKLSKEFETLGFFISDHPLNQYKSLFKKYKILNYNSFLNNSEHSTGNVACTILKIQEKKTQKGSSYAIVKFSDLNEVFELFIFSDLFELNRELFYEGNSLLVTVSKNNKDEVQTQTRINVRKIISLKDIINKPIDNIIFKFDNLKDLNILNSLSKNDAKTSVKFILANDHENLIFELKDKRYIDQNIINSLNLEKNILDDYK